MQEDSFSNLPRTSWTAPRQGGEKRWGPDWLWDDSLCEIQLPAPAKEQDQTEPAPLPRWGPAWLWEDEPDAEVKPVQSRETTPEITACLTCGGPLDIGRDTGRRACLACEVYVDPPSQVEPIGLMPTEHYDLAKYYWDQLTDEERLSINADRPIGKCAFCGAQLRSDHVTDIGRVVTPTRHSVFCDELHDSWIPLMPWGKNKGKRLADLETGYLLWLSEPERELSKDFEQAVLRVLKSRNVNVQDRHRFDDEEDE